MRLQISDQTLQLLCLLVQRTCEGGYLAFKDAHAGIIDNSRDLLGRGLLFMR